MKTSISISEKSPKSTPNAKPTPRPGAGIKTLADSVSEVGELTEMFVKSDDTRKIRQIGGQTYRLSRLYIRHVDARQPRH